jgi:archaemetzincin
MTIPSTNPSGRPVHGGLRGKCGKCILSAMKASRWSFRSLISLLPLLASCAHPVSSPPPEVPPEAAFEPSPDFKPLPAPGPSDWLAQRQERGQTFEQFVQANPNRPDESRNRIYLQPLGEIPPDAEVSFAKLQEFTQAFFQMDVVVRPPLDLSGAGITSRRNPAMGHQQLRTHDLLDFLAARLPDDAYAMLGVTLEDLYPRDTFNFVFGQADTPRRVGIYSFARYDPRFSGEERPSDWQKMALLRSCKILAHEISHLFSIRHCTAYHCLINGSNSLQETDQAPIDLCPIDLRKLHHGIGFEVIKRYRDLHDFSEREGFEEEAAWFRRRIEHLGG